MRLIQKGKREKTWCDTHRRLHSGKRCPKCVSYERWARKRFEQITAFVREVNSLAV